MPGSAHVIFDDVPGLATGWRPATVRLIEKAYGYWLGFVQARTRLGRELPPVIDITPEMLADYIASLRPTCHDMTLVMRVEGLLEAARVMAPNHDWDWLRRAVSRLKATARPSRSKLRRLRPSAELWRFGHDLMAEAEAMAERRPLRSAARFRDGLMIAFLAARPLRVSSLAALRLGTSLVDLGDGWWLRLEGTATKTGLAFEAPWPQALVPNLELYLDWCRPRLLKGAADDHAWITKDGMPMRPGAIYTRVTRLTRRYLGVAVNPHLFRDRAATSIAIENPTYVRIAAPLLGHRSLATTERYYNQALSLEAGRAYQRALRRLRRDTATAIRSHRRRRSA